MKILKIIGIVLLSIVVIFFILGFIMPKTITLERRVSINEPIEKVFPEIQYLDNFKNWSPWQDYDPDMKVQISEKDGMVGGIYSWTGNKDVGTGYMEIEDIEPNERIEWNLVFTDPWESSSSVYFDFNPNGDETEVVWGYEEQTKFPANVFMGLMGVKKMLAKDFDKGLVRLKERCEKS